LDDQDLVGIRSSLLGGLRVKLTPQQGVEAFERHQLLAIRFHRAARLNGRAGDCEGQGWSRYFAEHFPRGDTQARLLWSEWRVPLLKDETPGKGIAITHGQPQTHWKMTDRGFCIDLESMWDDYEQSVDNFVAMLASEAGRRRVGIDRWRARQWTVQPVQLVPSESLMPSDSLVPLSASYATSASAIAPPPRSTS
jgi:hypothetical protein